MVMLNFASDQLHDDTNAYFEHGCMLYSLFLLSKLHDAWLYLPTYECLKSCFFFLYGATQGV